MSDYERPFKGQDPPLLLSVHEPVACALVTFFPSTFLLPATTTRLRSLYELETQGICVRTPRVKICCQFAGFVVLKLLLPKNAGSIEDREPLSPVISLNNREQNNDSTLPVIFRPELFLISHLVPAAFSARGTTAE